MFVNNIMHPKYYTNVRQQIQNLINMRAVPVAALNDSRELLRLMAVVDNNNATASRCFKTIFIALMVKTGLDFANVELPIMANFTLYSALLIVVCVAGLKMDKASRVQSKIPMAMNKWAHTMADNMSVHENTLSTGEMRRVHELLNILKTR